MEKLEDILKAGGKSNSLGRANEVIDIVLGDHSRLGELYACISADDPWVRMRAADSFEKICRVRPAWAGPYTDAMLRDLTGSTQPSVQWHLAQIFTEVELASEQKDKAVTWLKALLETPETDWIVSVNAMKALLYFRRSGLVGDDELLALFAVQARHKSKSVRKKAAGFMEMLKTGA